MTFIAGDQKPPPQGNLQAAVRTGRAGDPQVPGQRPGRQPQPRSCGCLGEAIQRVPRRRRSRAERAREWLNEGPSFKETDMAWRDANKGVPHSLDAC